MHSLQEEIVCSQSTLVIESTTVEVLPQITLHVEALNVPTFVLIAHAFRSPPIHPSTPMIRILFLIDHLQ